MKISMGCGTHNLTINKHIFIFGDDCVMIMGLLHQIFGQDDFRLCSSQHTQLVVGDGSIFTKNRDSEPGLTRACRFKGAARSFGDMG